MTRRLLLQIPPLCAVLTGISVATAADNSTADGSAPVQLQEITITATKQASAVDVSTVPISISAYTKRDLDAQGANSIDQIAAMTPGVHFTQVNQYGGSAQTNIEIRGIQSRTGAPTTGIYYDDTPILASANEFNNGATLLYPVVFDMQRVEVLRGPQGTLFGDSAEGGAVRFIPTPASLTKFSSAAVASVSGTRYGDASYEAGVAEGGPIVDGSLGFRASAYYRRDGGWIDRCQPLVGQSGCGAILGRDVNSQDTAAVRLAALWAVTDSLRITPDVYYQRVHYKDGGGYEIADSNPAAGQYAFALNLPIPATDQMLIPSLKIEADLGYVSMTSITSYVWQNQDFWNSYTEYQDFAFFGTPYAITPTDYAQAEYITKRNDLYEELRFASTHPEDRVTWVAGAFLQAARQADHSRVVHPDLPQLITALYPGHPTIEQVLGVPPYLGTYVYWADSPTYDKQVALFGNADVKLTQTLKATLGLRYAHYKTDSTLFLAGPFNGGNTSFAGGASSNSVTPKVGLSWQPNDSSLYYISAGKGYRAGGVNDQTTSLIPTCHVSAPVDIKPDSLWSYELGAKNYFFDRRVAVDASAYYVIWNNIQNFTDIPQCGIGATFNLGDVVSKGFDLSTEALLTQNLKVDLDVAYTDAYFKNTVVVASGGIGQIVTSGDRVAGASVTSGPPVPPWSINVSGEYDFHPMGKTLYVSVQDQYASRNNGPFFTHDPANAELYDPSLPTDPATNLLNLRFGWRMTNGWDVKLFANNVLNAHPQLSVNHALPSDPRLSASTFRPLTIGISGTYSP